MRSLLILCISLVYLSPLYAGNERLIEYTKVATYDVAQLEEKWKEAGIKEFITPVRYAVDVYEVLYTSEWHDGSPIYASGLYYVPVGADEPSPKVIMNHGTRLERDRNVRLGGLQAICAAFATDGYVVLYPDFVGLGKGDKFHLYHHAETEALSNIDMLRAIEPLNKELGIETNDQLFITGYSQGGHVAMAAHKFIQEEYSDEFIVTASSPMSGAYDLTGVASETMFKPYSHPGYLPYLLLSMHAAYNIWDGDIYEIFKEPYGKVIREKLNNNHSLKDLNPYLPEIPADMIAEHVIEQFKSNPDFPFSKRLAENNVYNWTPESPMQLCYCNADEQVDYRNTMVAYETMKGNGAEHVTLRRGGKKYGHNKCALFTSIYTKFYFDSFRKGSKKGRKGPLFKRFMISLAKLKIKP